MRKFLLTLVATLTVTAPFALATAPAEAATMSQQQAVGSAQDYLRMTAFSRAGLIEQLSSRYGSGFSKADAVYAVNHINVSWYHQAVRSAKSYLRMTHFSRPALIQQLQSPYGSQFTHGQAVYGVNHLGL